MKSKAVGGLTIFSVCCAIYVRTSVLAPSPEELKDPAFAERSRYYGGENDPGGLLYGMRKYVLLVGVIGLFVAAEDYFLERSKQKKEAEKAKAPFPSADPAKPVPPPTSQQPPPAS